MIEKETSALNNSQPKPFVKCKECGEAFSKNCQLEEHLEEHANVKKFQCETCRKEFYLKWRLRKHMEVHSEEVKVCRYYKSNQSCPFEPIGCMFRHEIDNANSRDEIMDVGEESEGNDFIPDENQCHICRKQCKCKDDLFNHVEREHVEYFNGMLEAAANLSNTAF